MLGLMLVLHGIPHSDTTHVFHHPSLSLFQQKLIPFLENVSNFAKPLPKILTFSRTFTIYV